jgi:hypothetical protein
MPLFGASLKDFVVPVSGLVTDFTKCITYETVAVKTHLRPIMTTHSRVFLGFIGTALALVVSAGLEEGRRLWIRPDASY